jgi:hypothetical protein
MDPKLVEVTQLFARFKAAYARNDLDVCANLLSQLKVRPSIGPTDLAHLLFFSRFVRFEAERLDFY